MVSRSRPFDATAGLARSKSAKSAVSTSRPALYRRRPDSGVQRIVYSLPSSSRNGGRA